MGDEESNSADEDLGADDSVNVDEFKVDREVVNGPSTGKTFQDETRQLTSYPTAGVAPSKLSEQIRQEVWTNSRGYRSSSAGPRSLFLRRSENGFGFTLRHFIVYPPESYAILAGDKRLGLRNGAWDEPMDTIFVKNVRENSPAALAGLNDGDRIVSVNGENIAGLSYATVIQLIHRTGNYLHLLVVPKENDILQLYFGETAHNPETNQRPSIQPPRSLDEPFTMNSQDTRQTSGLRRYARRDTSPAYPGITSTTIASHYPREDRTLSPSSSSSIGGVAGSFSRRASEGNNHHSQLKTQHQQQQQLLEYQPMSYQPLSLPQMISDTSSCGSSSDGMLSSTALTTTTMYPYNTAGCRLSLDGGLMGSSRDSSCDSSGTTTTRDFAGSDDSIMSRIRKSLEQREEFLRQPAYSAVPPPVADRAAAAKELYAVPQKLPVPMWPPTQLQQLASSNAKQENTPSVQELSPPGGGGSNKFKNKAAFFAGTLDRIQENIIVPNNETPLTSSSKVRGGENNDINNNSNGDVISARDILASGKVSPSSPFQLVSLRAKQFENGYPRDDKTDLYRSELARLSSKKNVINVASRKREFESKVYSDRKAFASRESRSLDSQKNTKNVTGSDKERNKSEISISEAVSSHRNKPVVRKDSYLAACSKPTITKNLSAAQNFVEASAPRNDKLSSSDDTTNTPQFHKRLASSSSRTNTNNINNDNGNTITASPNSPSRPTQLQLPNSGQPVKLRTTELFFTDGKFIKVTRKDNETKQENDMLDASKLNIPIPEDDKSTRRISYLKATSGDGMAVDSSEYELSDLETTSTATVPVDPVPSAVAPVNSVLGSRKITGSGSALSESEKENQPVIKEGSVLCKVTLIDGKRATDRSWKSVWLVLKGPILCVYKERRESLSSHSETPATFDRTDLGTSCDRLDIRCSMVEVACDYTKRKHVFRLNAPSVGAELLLQTEDATAMTQWVKVLQEQSIAPVDNQVSGTNVSPNIGNKTIKKLTALRNRSPTGESPVTKSRKPANTEQLQSSPKSKTWKNRMARQFKRIQPGGNSPVSPLYPPGATIGIPLEGCPSSTFSEFVPLLVELCTGIVEARGLEIIGIYRVPGNTAAVTSLTEAINRGIHPNILSQDPRWSDVNVISSLLKSFFRRLPDSLLTSELYPHFIKADKYEDPIYRMETIRKLIHHLPDHNFETLRYLMFHLKKVVGNSSVNKMEAKNLAIVFGPTLVRTSEDNMVTMVTDMSHQCRIVESLISHVDWCFGDGNIADLKANIPDNSSNELEPSSSNHNLLLGNIRKVEGMQSPVTAKDIVSTIIGAANRKMQKATTKHSSSSTSHSSTGTNSSSSNKNKTSVTTTTTNSTHSTTTHHTTSSSEDVLDNFHKDQNSNKSKSSSSHRDNENSKLLSSSVERGEESRSANTSSSAAVPQQNSSERIPKEVNDANKLNDDDSNNWTYAGLSATTQERIRRFEQETKAMLDRELTRQKRVVSQKDDEDVVKDSSNSSRMVNKEYENTININNNHNRTSSGITIGGLNNSIDKSRLSYIDEVIKEEKEDERHDNSAPIVVMRRNSTSVNGNTVSITDADKSNKKRLKTGKEIIANALQRSDSLDSIHKAELPPSHVSDDGGDLLLSLTTTFDKKLKSLSGTSDNDDEEDENSQNDNSDNCFRDPSLHKSSDKPDHYQENEKDTSEKENQPAEVNNNTIVSADNVCNNNDDNAVVVSDNSKLNFEDLIQQSIALLSSINSNLYNNNNNNNRKEPSRLFYSNSVKIRRSESFNKYHENGGVKLRRSGSLKQNNDPHHHHHHHHQIVAHHHVSQTSQQQQQQHRFDPKMSKFESFILTKNADAVKLKRYDSLTKNEKTESNKRRQQQQLQDTKNGSVVTKFLIGSNNNNNNNNSSSSNNNKLMKRKFGILKDRNIKRRHTVGGTKDFDKSSWQKKTCITGTLLDDDPNEETRRERRTSSPDLSSSRLSDLLADVMIRPKSIVSADLNYVSRLFNLPLESHV